MNTDGRSSVFICVHRWFHCAAMGMPMYPQNVSLNPNWTLRAGRELGIHARRVRHETGIRVVEIDEVEGVKGLAPEFHPDPLGEFEIPENGERDLLITWPARPGQRARRVADDKVRRVAEALCPEPAAGAPL